MSHVQLRNYTIKPGMMDEFVTWWQGLMPLRAPYGYRIVFAFADRANNQFLWAVEADKPFAELDPVWESAPERAEHFKSNPGAVASMVVTEPESISWS
jgi:hypothetical protein